jgi:glycerol uptake facilitator-like aquaporin
MSPHTQHHSDYPLSSLAAEFLGSALFVFIACGAGMTTTKYQFTGNITIGIAMTFGFTIFVIAFAIGHIR